ncbi:MAG: NCS2 family permease [Elusimicrobiota bacterium]
MTAAISRFFELEERNTNVRTELAAGLTTFMTMAYIIFVQPQVLGAAGMDKGAVLVATCLSSALACFLMGILANYPIAQAPLMGENFFFAYTVILGMGIPWEKALGLVFLSGVLFLALTLTQVREMIVNSVPEGLKYGIAVGIGFFVTLIGLKEAGVVVFTEAAPKLGPVTSLPVALSLAGFTLMAVLTARRVKGAVLIGILATGVAAWACGLVVYEGLVSAPPSLSPTFLKFDLAGLWRWEYLSLIIVFLYMTLFDTVGTLLGVSIQADLLKDGKLPRASRALMADAVATTVGACLGTSTVSSYIESSTGVRVGGRTGLTAVTVGGLFLAALFAFPLVRMISGGVEIAGGHMIHPITAPALILVGAFMVEGLRRIDWKDFTESMPAFLTIVCIPFTFSIAEGIAIGFISYPILKAAAGRPRDASPLVWVMATLFVLRYVFLD